MSLALIVSLVVIARGEKVSRRGFSGAGRLIGGCTVCSELLGNCFLAGTVDRTGIKYMDP